MQTKLKDLGNDMDRYNDDIGKDMDRIRSLRIKNQDQEKTIGEIFTGEEKITLNTMKNHFKSYGCSEYQSDILCMALNQPSRISPIVDTKYYECYSPIQSGKELLIDIPSSGNITIEYYYIVKHM